MDGGGRGGYDPRMITALDGLTVDLVPHAQSVTREGWTGKESARPLSPWSRGVTAEHVSWFMNLSPWSACG